MKKVFVLIVLISSGKFFAQENITPKEEVAATENTFDKADKPAEYPGGISTFRTAFTKVFNFNPSSKGKVSSVVSFVVSEQGQIGDIVATGENKKMNKEMEKAIKKLSNILWKPAEIDGKPVKFRYKLPISTEFYN